jgi:membrane peptidoglycan carboxypeptidase
LVTRVVVIALVWSGTGAAAAEAYVDSIPLPGDPPDPQASTLYYNDGRTILARVGITDHSDVPLSAVPVAVRDTVLAAEDRDFYGHWGISPRGVLRALVADAGGARQGASTITQQYARNAFLSQNVTVDRKARELALSIKLERQFSKDQILEKYLNTIYFGRGAYGIAAAAHAYFGITTDRLTPAQGAVLAAVIKDPYNYDPAVDAKAARGRWNWIVAAAAKQGWVAKDQQYPAIARRDDAAVDGPNGLVVDQIEHELANRGVSSQELHTRGLQITTTLDPAAQKAALSSVAEQLRKQPRGLQAALVALDPRSGAVRAYYGGDRGRGYYDYASALHPAASTFKPIVLAAALRAGIGYQSRWDGSSPRIFPGRNGVPLKNHDNLQCPYCTLEQSMVDSLNTPFYAVAERVGADRVRAMAVDLGISDKYRGQPSMVDLRGDPKPGRTRPDIAIGRYPVTPGDLASVYATFAAGGVRHDRYFVQSARDAIGRALLPATPGGTTVLDTRIAADVSTVLSAVVKGDDVVPGRPAAGKTGTQQWGNTKDNQDAWMAGYTPDLAAAVWLGKAVPGPIRDAHDKPISGETVPARLWRDFVTDALHGKPKEQLPAPAHVGRNDVGDAGKTHGPDSPDDVANARAATDGFDPVVHTAGPGKRLALTFDDGPSGYTPAILDLLAKYHIKATFCMVGEQVQAYPQTVRRIVAEGHRLCNHSMHHDDLADMSTSKIKDDIGGTDTEIGKAAPGTTVTYFRAPYGDWGRSAKVGAQLGHTPLGWLVDPDDWMLPGADVIASRIEQQVTPRAVVLVHDGGGERQQTIDALEKAIPKLLGDGWTFDFPATTVQSHALPSTHEPSAPAATATTGGPENAGKPNGPTGDQPPSDGTGGDGTAGDGDPTGGKPTGRPDPGDGGAAVGSGG